MGTYARTEISQDVDNADRNVKWFLKVHKTYKRLWEAYFQCSFYPRFYSGSYFTFKKCCFHTKYENPLYLHFKYKGKVINFILKEKSLNKTALPS